VRNVWISGLPVILTVLLILSGVLLVYFGFPAFVQPFQLLFGFSIICSEVWLVLHLGFFKKSSTLAA
jgi:hypothetical protein